MTRLSSTSIPTINTKKELHKRLIAGIDLAALGRLSEDELRLQVRRGAEELCRHGSNLLSLGERENLVSEVLDEIFGLGPLEPLMHDPNISDILINGPRTVYVERFGRLEPSDVVFNDDRHLVSIVQTHATPSADWK
jgi:pilus assembly protein CpaF